MSLSEKRFAEDASRSNSKLLIPHFSFSKTAHRLQPTSNKFPLRENGSSAPSKSCKIRPAAEKAFRAKPTKERFPFTEPIPHS